MHPSWDVCSVVFAIALCRPDSSTGYIPREIVLSGTTCVVKRNFTMWFGVERKNHRRTSLEATSTGVALCNQAVRQVLQAGSAEATRASAQRYFGLQILVVASARRCSAIILSAKAAVLTQKLFRVVKSRKKKDVASMRLLSSLCYCRHCCCLVLLLFGSAAFVSASVAICCCHCCR